MYELFVQVWGDPAFRSFFPDSGEQLGWPAGSGEKPGEPSQPSPHHSEQPVNYRAPAADMAPSFPIYPRKSPLPSPPEDGREASEGTPPDGRGASQYPASPPEPSRQHFPSPGTEGEAGTPPQYSQYPPPQAAYPSHQYSPRPEMLDEGPPAEPQDFSCERVREPPPPDPPMQQPLYPATREASSYDIIRNMTEKYGGLTGGGGGGEGARETAEGFETRRNHLESVLSKMNRTSDADGMPGQALAEAGGQHGMPEHLRGEGGEGAAQARVAAIEESPPVRTRSPQQQKPIKLRIAGGEVVANTVLDGELEPIKVKLEVPKPKVDERMKQLSLSCTSDGEVSRFGLDKSLLLSLHMSIQTDDLLKERVSDVVGEDVLSIFADAVSEAQTSREVRVSNKNIVFLYYAVKNSTQLDLESIKKTELEPLSNLALSIPLLSRLLAFVASDIAVKEQLEEELGKEHMSWLEGVVAASCQRGEEFLHDPSLAPRAVPLYHSARNLVLQQTFERMTTIAKKSGAILTRTSNSEDQSYNTALAKLQSLVAAPWTQQVIAAEAMKFDFQFLGTVHTFWKKVISSRANRPEKKARKTKLKLDPSSFESLDRPKRSSRRRDEVITYDEDIMQNCVTRGNRNMHDVKQEPVELD